ncbi:MAG: glycogen/starch synthase [Salibacteraceae bacterium]
MRKARVLFVSQEIMPYLPESEMSSIGRNLPQGIQEKGKEIRTFMPRFGTINERRHQLHEVIRLSGMNLIIDDSDHPLIIKVASIQPARMQVYFIDNEEYFQRKAVLTDKEGTFFEDNDERSIFFCRGVLETVKKLGWAPDIIHCHGWMTAVLPLYLKRSYKDDPMFSESKVIYSMYDKGFDGTLNSNFANKVIHEGISENDVDLIRTPDLNNLHRLGASMSDAFIQGSENIDPELQKFVEGLNKPNLGYHNPETYIDAYSSFYDEVLEENSILVD